MPPRHGKSEFVSRRLPAAFLAANPGAQVIQCSYSAALAAKENRRVQRIMLAPQYRALYPNTHIPSKDGSSSVERRYVRNNQQFEVFNDTGDQIGQYICAGIGGPITGEGMTLGIVDDPIKNAEEANSETYRNNIWNWWDSTFLTRDEGDAALVVCATRWHDDDLIGRILARAAETGEKWTVVNFEALREDMTDPTDPRKEGEALWPAKFSTKKMNEIKRRLEKGLGVRWWDAMYQQRPSSLQGNILKREYWAYFDPADPPKYVAKIQSYDTASDTKSVNDWSVGGTFGIHTDPGSGDAVADLIDLWRERVEFPGLKAQAVALGHRDNPSWILIERKSSGTQLIQEMQANTRLPIWGPPPDKPGGKSKPLGVPVDTDKVSRAMAATGLISAKRIRLPKDSPWLADFLSETANFPNAKFDDQVDMLTQFINWFRQHWRTPRQSITNPKGRTIRGRF